MALNIAKGYQSSNKETPIFEVKNIFKKEVKSRIKKIRKNKGLPKFGNKFLIKESEKINRKSDYFSNIIKASPVKFRFFYFHGKGDLVDGYNHWINYERKIREKKNSLLKVYIDAGFKKDIHKMTFIENELSIDALRKAKKIIKMIAIKLNNKKSL